MVAKDVIGFSAQHRTGRDEAQCVDAPNAQAVSSRSLRPSCLSRRTAISICRFGITIRLAYNDHKRGAGGWVDKERSVAETAHLELVVAVLEEHLFAAIATLRHAGKGRQAPAIAVEARMTRANLWPNIVRPPIGLIWKWKVGHAAPQGAPVTFTLTRLSALSKL